MSFAKVTIVLLSVFLVSACALTQRCNNNPLQLTNKSELTLKQAYTAGEVAFYSAQSSGGCRCGIDSVDVQQSLTQKTADFKTSASGHVISGSLTERWLTHGCGKVYPFDVKIVPDGKGGTDIYTSRVISDWPK